MIPVDLINEQAGQGRAPQRESLAAPSTTLLARLIESRLENENKPTPRGWLPKGVRRDLRPTLPNIGMAAVMLFSNRRAVQSYPLLYTTLALAHPN